jgi:HlyD family secretion protein
VRIAVDRPEAVRSGMFAAAEVVVETRAALAAPISAIAGGTGGRDGAARPRRRRGAGPVVLGVRDGDRVEIRDGLAEGDLVVAKAGAFVRDGDRINPVPAEPPSAAATN